MSQAHIEAVGVIVSQAQYRMLQDAGYGENAVTAYYFGAELGARFLRDTDEDVTALEDEHAAVSLAFDIYENYSQYSPFEQSARDMNDCEDSGDVWESFNEGMTWGARYSYWALLCGCSFDKRGELA